MAKRTVSKCKCGRRKSKYANYCKACDAKREAARKAEAAPIIASGVCPKCGTKLKRNLSLTGWYQCSQYGAETHRADPSKPSCSFQIFA